MVQMLKILIFCFIFLWYWLSLRFCTVCLAMLGSVALKLMLVDLWDLSLPGIAPAPIHYSPQNFYILNWFLFAWMMMFICINSTLNVPAAASTTNNSTNETKWKHYSGKRFLFLVWKRLEIHHQNESIIR